MTCHTEFEKRDCDVLLDILRKEHRELSVEVHRTDRFEARRILQERLDTVEHLLELLEAAQPQDVT
jgi:hypothetical protein